ncbi:MAG: pilus assembly protein [Pirellulaceae bacterium]|nr:pilus assembly protein [Pirellulaceae bacterium]
MRSRKLKSTWRSAVAAVEFAVMLPPVVLIVFGTIEVARAFSVQHALQEASMVGCRIYALGEKTQQDAIDFIDLSLAEANISGYSIAFDPALKSDIDVDLEPVKVTISIPFSSVGFGLHGTISGSNIKGESVLPADLLGAATSTGT